MSDLIERQTVIDALDHVINNGAKNKYFDGHFITAEAMKEYILSLPSTQPNLQPTCNQLATDCISRQDAIDMIMGKPPEAHYPSWYAEQIKALPSAQPEQSTEIQDILTYLDEEVHPIVAPDNWKIYSELRDMISELSAQPEQINPCTICQEFDCYGCKFRRTT